MPSLTYWRLCAPMKQTTQAWTSVRSLTWWTRASKSTHTVLWLLPTTATSWSAASGTRASVFTPLKLVGFVLFIRAMLIKLSINLLLAVRCFFLFLIKTAIFGSVRSPALIMDNLDACFFKFIYLFRPIALGEIWKVLFLHMCLATLYIPTFIVSEL